MNIYSTSIWSLYHSANIQYIRPNCNIKISESEQFEYTNTSIKYLVLVTKRANVKYKHDQRWRFAKER